MLLLLVALLIAVVPANTVVDWRTISLSDRPINLTSHTGTLWVCGTDELIASSSDAGTIWQTKHREVDGEVLTQISFINEKVGYAAGTNGLVLWTTDGGEHWKPTRSGSESPTFLFFADEHHGIQSTRSRTSITLDGGLSWQQITVIDSNRDLKKFPYVGGIAALDADHYMILLLQGPLSDWRFLSTQDAGKTWRVIEIPAVGLLSLVVRDGKYWAFGHEVIERDKPGGGYGVALVLYSADGEHWEHGTRSPKEYIDCNTQGCLIWDGAIVDVFNEKPVFTVVPPGGNLTNKWASTGATVCSVSTVLNCVAASQSEELPERPSDALEGWHAGIPFLEPDIPGCIHCSHSYTSGLPPGGFVRPAVHYPGQCARAVHGS